MAKNNKTRVFYVLYSDKTWVFEQSERAQGPIYIIHLHNLGVPQDVFKCYDKIIFVLHKAQQTENLSSQLQI